MLNIRLIKQLLEPFQLVLQSQIISLQLMEALPEVVILVFQNGRPPLQRIHVLLLLTPALLGRDFVLDLASDLLQRLLLGLGQRQSCRNWIAFRQQRPLLLFRQLQSTRRTFL